MSDPIDPEALEAMREAGLSPEAPGPGASKMHPIGFELLQVNPKVTELLRNPTQPLAAPATVLPPDAMALVAEVDAAHPQAASPTPTAPARRKGRLRWE